jgi:hypothetical protein
MFERKTVSPDSSEPSAILLAIALQLGVCIVLLAETATAVRGYTTLVGMAGYVVGVLTIVGSVATYIER